MTHTCHVYLCYYKCQLSEHFSYQNTLWSQRVRISGILYCICILHSCFCTVDACPCISHVLPCSAFIETIYTQRRCVYTAWSSWVTYPLYTTFPWQLDMHLHAGIPCMHKHYKQLQVCIACMLWPSFITCICS